MSKKKDDQYDKDQNDKDQVEADDRYDDGYADDQDDGYTYDDDDGDTYDDDDGYAYDDDDGYTYDDDGDGDRYDDGYRDDDDDGYDEEDGYRGSGKETRGEQDEVKKKKGRKKLSSNAKWGITLIIELIVIVGLIFALVRSYVHNKYALLDVHEIKQEDLGINDGVDKNAVKGFTNIALFGIDSRSGSLDAGGRSDALLVLSINNDTKKMKLVSVYRDTIMEVPEGDDKYTVKVNAAYAYGGPELAIKTLNANLDLTISDYITINWEGLTRAIDSIGGVPIHVEEDELETLNACLAEQISVTGIYSDGVFETGDLILNGSQATAYARIRSTGRGDITRTERQREVLSAMLRKLRGSSLSTIDNTIDIIFPYISTSITEDDMYDLASKLISLSMDETLGFPVRFGYYNSDEKGACIAAQTLQENVIALHRFLYGNTSFTPSQNLRRISDVLVKETGFDSEGTVLLPSEQSTEQ